MKSYMIYISTYSLTRTLHLRFPVNASSHHLHRLTNPHSTTVYSLLVGNCRTRWPEMFEAEWKRMQKNLNRLMHHQLFTRRILDVADNEWRKTDDNLRKRQGLYQSSNDEGFKVHFKGLLSVKSSCAGIGVVIYDARDRCVFELRKHFMIVGDGGPTDGELVEIRGLIEGVYAAITFGLKRVDIFCDNKSVYQYLIGKERPTNKLTVTLVDALILIQRKVGYRVRGPLLTRNSHVKLACKLAKAAIACHTTKLAESALEQCTICFEYTCKDKMFSVNKCLHRYCYSCMNKHVESRLLQGQLPKCPHEECRSQLEIKSCKKFLNKNLYNIMSSRLKEASIPPTERVYCPFSKCSALMSKAELQHAASTSSQESGKRRCFKCHGIFCINCKVPWHDKSKCSDYIKYSNNQFVDEVKLKSLATSNRWRQCIECMQMIELAAGCHHIICRCGHEFCYMCGARWINKKATCACPLWDIGYILYNA